MAGTEAVTATVTAVALRVVAIEDRKSLGDLSMMMMMKGRVMMMVRERGMGRLRLSGLGRVLGRSQRCRIWVTQMMKRK